MLIKKGSNFELYPFKVKYMQNGKEHEQWATPSKEWWIEFADKWKHTEIIEFSEVEVTDDMQKRFEEIRNMPEGFNNVYADYVLDGTLPNEFPETHPFRQIMLKKENEELQKTNADLSYQLMLSQSDIDGNGTSISELTYQLMMKGVL